MIRVNSSTPGFLAAHPLCGLLKNIGHAADEAGRRAAVVGGFVRDLLLGKPCRDLDVVVEQDAKDLGLRLTAHYGWPVTMQSAFGTLRLATDWGPLDIATARTERYPRPGALPVITPAPLEHDMGRRDYSINAMAILLNQNSFGQLMDPFDGRRDLAAGWLRILHPRSFEDDPTRLLRGLRLAYRLSYRFEPATDRQLRKAIEGKNWTTISCTRLGRELELLFEEDDWRGLLRFMEEYSLFTAIFGRAVSQQTEILLEQGAQALDYLAQQQVPINRLGLIATLLGAEHLLSGQERKRLLAARGQLGKMGALRTASRRQIYTVLRQIPLPVLAYLWIMCQNGEGQQPLRLFLDELRHIEPLLALDDVADLVSGDRGRFVYRELRAAKLDGNLPTMADELCFVRRVAAGNGNKGG